MFRKNNTSKGLLLLLSLFLFNQCTEKPQDDTAYLQTIETWQEDRNAEMRDTSSSWLCLVGLHWLEQGESTFGADSSNTIVFPNSAPAFAGSFVLQDTALQLKMLDGAAATHEGAPVQELMLGHDMSGATTYLQMGSINFHAIQRPEGMAIRVKDSQSPDLLAFEDIPNFPIDLNWKIEARLDWFEEPKLIQIPTVLGSERTQKCPALLVFEVDGEQYELSPYESFYGDPVWTLIFSDVTNGEKTYGGGRFLSLAAPEPGTNSITLDFNKAYNPPCAFSPFATCPLPPPENRLPLSILAGEMMYGAPH